MIFGNPTGQLSQWENDHRDILSYGGGRVKDGIAVRRRHAHTKFGVRVSISSQLWYPVPVSAVPGFCLRDKPGTFDGHVFWGLQDEAAVLVRVSAG